jgi:peptidoglycan/LPS O-acetylase OafA/YrhL
MEARASTEPASSHEHGLPPLSDPGKVDRARHGLPVVPEFDGYRALAIFGILAMHCVLAAGVVAGPGDDWGDKLMAGVGPWLISILFIVSGFVVFLPTVARAGDFGSVGGYAIRRAARLLPAFWVAMLVVLVLMAADPDTTLPGFGDAVVTFAGQDSWATLLTSGFATGFGVNGPIWSLTLEIGFYIVLPFIASTYFRHPLVGLLIAALVSIGWRVAFKNVTDIADLVGADPSPLRVAELQLASYIQLPSWAFAFGAGMTAAWAYVTFPRRLGREQVARMARVALALSLSVVAICAYISAGYATGTDANAVGAEVQQSIPLFLAYIAAIASAMVALALSGLRSPFSTPIARRLGDISYGVFLIQIPIIWAIVHWAEPTFDGSPRTFLIYAGVTIPLSALYGYLSARFVEQPIRRWARRFGRRAQPVQSASAQA